MTNQNTPRRDWDKLLNDLLDRIRRGARLAQRLADLVQHFAELVKEFRRLFGPGPHPTT